jgi:hypothetical protein
MHSKGFWEEFEEEILEICVSGDFFGRKKCK